MGELMFQGLFPAAGCCRFSWNHPRGLALDRSVKFSHSEVLADVRSLDEGSGGQLECERDKRRYAV